MLRDVVRVENSKYRFFGALIRICKCSVVALVIATLAAVAHATAFYAKAGSARVIDAVTGQPIEAVIVEASWEITNYRDPASPPLGELAHADARTSADGEFTLSAWGPVTVNLHSDVRSVVKVLDHSQPHLYLYKRGYHSSMEKGPTEDSRSFWDQFLLGGDKRDAWWDQRIFRLDPSLGPIAQRRYELSLALAALGDRKWVRLPRVAAAYITAMRQVTIPRQSRGP